MMKMKKMSLKWTAVLCAVLLLLCIIPLATPVIRATAVSSEAQLKTALQANAAINLKSDITVSTGIWTSYDYNNTFNGNGHVISGLNAPLFDTLGANASVINLGVAGNVTQAMLNPCALFALESSGVIRSCFAYGDITYSGNNTVGGMIATMKAGSVTDSFACMNIQSTSAASYVGGLIGKIEGGTVTGCYSAGTIDAVNAVTYTAGLANLGDDVVANAVSETYTTCQLLHNTPRANPSGVDGLYDNQLALVRESLANTGLSTMQLMGAEAAPATSDYNTLDLSDTYYLITSTAYPSLKTFYKSMWSDSVRDIVQVSTAAVAFSDIEGVSQRYEPSTDSDAFVARADYLTSEMYADKTNVDSLVWTVESADCRIYDTVPVTNVPLSSKLQQMFHFSENASDLLRSKFVFSADATDTPLTVTSDRYSRKWYLTVRMNANPYFPQSGGNGDSATTPFIVANKTQFDHIRYYSLIDAAYYKATANLSLPQWTPIEDFAGVFDGNKKTFSNVTIDPSYEGANVGIFANTQPYATVKNMYLSNVVIDYSATELPDSAVGSLIGYAGRQTSVRNVVLYGTYDANDANSTRYGVIKGKHTVGGLIGKGASLTVTEALVSVELEGLEVNEQGLGGVGGIVGLLEGGTLSRCGSTGYAAAGKYVGGLVGQNNGTVTMNHCYSTATVISDQSGAYVGGLIGYAGTGTATIQNSYTASLADAPNGSAHPISGGNLGTISNTFFDKSYALNAYESDSRALVTSTLIAKSFSASYWTKTSTNYPQLKLFAGTSGKLSSLSSLSTKPVTVQRQWEDTDVEDMTTGWIKKDTWHQPTNIAYLEDDNAKTAHIHPLDNGSGYMFEASSDQRRVVLRTADTSLIATRVMAYVREDLIPIRYTVEGITDAAAYVQLQYGTNGDWKEYDVMTVTGGESEVLYNIPKNQQVRVRVYTEDAYAVESVALTCDEVSEHLSVTDGYYTDAGSTYNAAVTVAIRLANAAPVWGLQRQSY